MIGVGRCIHDQFLKPAIEVVRLKSTADGTESLPSGEPAGPPPFPPLPPGPTPESLPLPTPVPFRPPIPPPEPGPPENSFPFPAGSPIGAGGGGADSGPTTV